MLASAITPSSWAAAAAAAQNSRKTVLKEMGGFCSSNGTADNGTALSRVHVNTFMGSTQSEKQGMWFCFRP